MRGLWRAYDQNDVLRDSLAQRQRCASTLLFYFNYKGIRTGKIVGVMWGGLI